ncbi:hypothetical protein [Paenibacillus sp. LjRoot56]|uniref:hypothetical protein n=1 Tax=Paenibacillus sp. LjRoot56 TaxID=3342333 RepID=UPI003ECED378
MYPLYGKIFVAVSFITVLVGVFLMNRSQKSEGIFSSKKIQWILSPILLVIFIVSVVFVLQAKDVKHRREITNLIESKGAVVISIESSRKSLTPFKEWDKGRAKPKDDYFFVTYSLKNQIKTAWFKGDNALYKETPTPEKEKWIFDVQ